MINWSNAQVVSTNTVTKKVAEDEFKAALREANRIYYVKVRCKRCGIKARLSDLDNKGVCLVCQDEEEV